MTEKNVARKIAFVGTSSIGKTTLIDELKKINSGNPGVAFVPEAARVFFTDNPNIQDRFSAAIQGVVQDLQLKFEKEAHSGQAQLIFCDRSVLDAVVYSRSTGDVQGSDALLAKVIGWLPTYDSILLLDPNDVLYQKDAIRQEDEQVYTGFHKAFLDFFKEKRIPFELLSGTIEQRLARINEIIQE